MKILILCNGPLVEINGVPKQLLEVDGEAILDRTARLLMERGYSTTIITWNEELPLPGDDWHFPGLDPEGQAVGLSSSHLWSHSEDTVLLLGDVYYTEEAIDVILNTPVQVWTLFCRFGYNPDGSLGGGEGWAVKFPPSEVFRYFGTLEALSRLKLSVCHFWQQYRVMNGSDPKVHLDLGNRVIIDDLTEDFDTQEVYDRWLRKFNDLRVRANGK